LDFHTLREFIPTALASDAGIGETIFELCMLSATLISADLIPCWAASRSTLPLGVFSGKAWWRIPEIRS
jgi:hypothetical protein